MCLLLPSNKNIDHAKNSQNFHNYVVAYVTVTNLDMLMVIFNM